MTPEEMKQRTKRFALRVIHLVESLPQCRAAEVIGRQLLRAGTSVGANYRAACCARSKPDFVAKMGIVQEEADESGYWIELLVEAGLVRSSVVKDLLGETGEILAIAVASINTAKGARPRAPASGGD